MPREFFAMPLLLITIFLEARIKKRKIFIKNRKNQAKKQKFQVFLFFIRCFILLIYICPVAMLRQLTNEENEHEKKKIDCHVDAAFCGGV